MTLARNCTGLALSLLACCALSAPAFAAGSSGSEPSTAKKAGTKKSIDRTGRAHKGKASYYGRQFHGKKMANGKPMNPNANVAASKTLPLGTTAKVTNLENGKSEVVKIEDRGPYVKDRIVDVSPKVANDLGMKKDGVAPVEVKPLSIPAKEEK